MSDTVRDLKDLSQVDQIVKYYYDQGLCPASIGHKLRDVYNIRVHNLTKKYPFLSETKSLKSRIGLRIQYLKIHMEKNKKDFVTERSLTKLRVLYKNLK